MISSAFIISYYFAFFHSHHSPLRESTTSLLCVAKIIVVPNLFIFSKILITSLVLTGSRLPVGSSATTKSYSVYYRSGNGSFLPFSAGKLIGKS